MSGHDADCPRAGAARPFEACGGCNRAARRRKVAELRALDLWVGWALGQPAVVRAGRTLAAVHYAVWVVGGLTVSVDRVRASAARLGWVEL